MEFEDRTLVCCDCSEEFVFAADEQQFYADKGFENDPKRCKPCRQRKKNSRNQGRGGFGQREMHTVTCADCGDEAQVPFKPSGDRPVYCRDCYQKNR
jgi:CxxC-x17-CxxC domain-containing protein